MTWELWAIVLSIGFTVSLSRALGRRARSRRVRNLPAERQVTAVGFGSPDRQALDIWVPAGTPLPTHHRRILRVPSKANELVLGVHTDEPTVEVLAELRIGPLRRGEQKVRLVELVVRISETGRMGFAAREKASGHRLKMSVSEPRTKKARREGLMLPTMDAPAGSAGDPDVSGDPLADISWHSVQR